jgi:hypothetical protein
MLERLYVLAPFVLTAIAFALIKNLGVISRILVCVLFMGLGLDLGEYGWRASGYDGMVPFFASAMTALLFALFLIYMRKKHDW